MGMTEHKKAGFALAALWVSGMSALAVGTHPGDTIATHTSDGDAAIYMPASALSSSAQTAGPVATIAAARSIDFIIRFDDKIDAIDRCLALNPDQLPDAQRIFSAWASDKDALSGMTLKKVTFSGEFILSWDAGTAGSPSRAVIDSKLEKIRALPAVRYADPDFTFQPEGAR